MQNKTMKLKYLIECEYWQKFDVAQYILNIGMYSFGCL